MITKRVGTSHGLSVAMLIGTLCLAGGAAADGDLASEQAEPAAAEAASEAPAATPPPADSIPRTAIMPSRVPYAPMKGEAMGSREEYPDLNMPAEPWRYDDTYLFAATRGLRGGDPSPTTKPLSGVEKGFSMIGTIPTDLLALVPAAFAGLWGS
jgi:hypothetical protein